MRAGALEEYASKVDGQRAAAPSCDPKAFPLSLARTGEQLRIAAFLTGKGLGKRLGDLGLHKGSVIQILHRERSGASVVVHDTNRVAIGASVAQMISVTLCENKTNPDCNSCEKA
ncbi:MAG: ferrous iron transport protein A [Rhodobacteraceae bacterium]|nr:ferrous iron transport protein A [Paracoccaceae bacterium]